MEGLLKPAFRVDRWWWCTVIPFEKLMTIKNSPVICKFAGSLMVVPISGVMELISMKWLLRSLHQTAGGCDDFAVGWVGA